MSKFKWINNKSFQRILLILSGDISLNPRPVYNSYSSCLCGWNVFKAKGIYLIHLKGNSLLPKLDEIRYVAPHTNAAVIGISQSKLDKNFLPLEIQISNYELFRCDGNRNGRGVVAVLEVIKVSYKNTFFRRKSTILLLKFFCQKTYNYTKPIIVGIIHRPPNESNFLDIVKGNFEELDTDTKELYILGDFNINMCQNNKHIVRYDNTISSKFPSSDITNY